MLQAVRLLVDLARTSDDQQSDQTMDGRTSTADDEGSVQFREIHKNGWLRRADKTDKELNRFWVAFCVHDDTEPRLEGFADQKQATTHSPMWAHSLRNALYLSPTLCATAKNDYEFCINFNDDRVVRLAASTYQMMYDWVHVVTRKLTDMKILRPKENIYSKGPERIATRDPTSPLPPPPVVPGPSEQAPTTTSTTTTTTPTTTPSSSATRDPPSENSNPLSVFTFDESQVEERRTRVQTQALRSAAPSPRPQASPAPLATEENSSYESIFLASSSTTPAPTEEVSRLNVNEQSQSQQNNGGNERYVALMEYRSAAGIRNPAPPPRESRSGNSGRRLMTLREQQVAQLKKEIGHPAGVRLQLGRRDCKDSIAFVETYGQIWVAGWKQREHPLLYNVLHIGDLVLSVAGVVPANVAAIKSILKNYSLPRVDVVVKRLPHAKVLILKKNSDMDDFGIDVSENEIVGVSETAQTAGLTLFTSPADQTMPDDSRVTWTVTELNGRPLNIFDGGVREKLGAVGVDVSLVVQPSDLVTSLRKKLRSIRGHKAFVA